MKKIVVLSDTHGNLKAIAAITEIMEESDMVIHLGDRYDDMELFAPILKSKLYRIHGNCDFGAQKELVIEVEGRRIFATHGDLYGVKGGTARLSKRAKELDCDVVLYGHTHNAEIYEREKFLMVNPGNMTNYGSETSFCYLVINGTKATAVINTATK
ncbi:MAG: metallophosphoesterase [Clostridia bacterium]|nr:metallophosphoesterase [Clostridia bacterium]